MSPFSENYLMTDRARSSSQSGVDNFDKQDPSFLKRRTYFPHVWLQDIVLTNRFSAFRNLINSLRFS